MSELTIAPYFPFRRIKIVNQTVFKDAAKAHIQIQPDRRFQPICHCCGHKASRVHSWTERRVRDLNLAATPVWTDNINWFVEAIAGLINDPWVGVGSGKPGNAMGRRFDQLIQAYLRGEYPLQSLRRAWLPLNRLTSTCPETIQRSIHRPGLGKLIHKLLGKV